MKSRAWLIACVAVIAVGLQAGGLASQKRQCRAGNIMRCMDVGVYYAARDRGAQAAPWLKRACSRGMADACDDLAFIYANAKGVRQNYTRAMRYWSRGCRLGSGSACTNYDLARQRLHRK